MTPPSDAFAATLARVWEQSLPGLIARVDAIDRAVAAAGAGDADAALMEAGRTEAHKLAGVLGTFGRARGTELARSLEARLAAGPGRAEATELAALAAALRAEIEA
jgi:HPt (histidine-containing phosphotransfer) domain-containing protein